MNQRTTARRGLTLFELILSIALSAVILVVIGMAIDLHLRCLNEGRSEVENSQIARSILRMIADDLRSAIAQDSADFSGAEELAGDTMAGNEVLGDAASDLGLGESSLSDSSGDISGAETVPVVPGLYGNQYEIQIDVSRLPRVDEFQRLVSSDSFTSVEDIPSDVKTIAYYVQDGYRPPAGMALPPSELNATGEQQGGLVRRVLDRAVTLYASENANLDGLRAAGEVIAPEVVSIEFEYFDGLEWLMEWDMETQCGLPLAVRVTLMLGDPEGELPTSYDTLSSVSSLSGTGGQVYSLVVRLPMADPVALSEASSGSDGLDSVGL